MDTTNSNEQQAVATVSDAEALATRVYFPATMFSMKVTDDKNADHNILVKLSAGYATVSQIANALYAGQSRRTAAQNEIKSKKNRNKPIPTELSLTPAEWIRDEQVARVVIVSAPMTYEQALAEMLKDPAKAQADLDAYYEKRAAEQKAAEAEEKKAKK